MHLIFCSAFPVFYLFPGKLLFTDEIGWGFFFYSKLTNGKKRAFFIFKRAKFSFLLGLKCCVMRQKRLGCVYMQDLSSWLLVNRRGVFGGADVTKFLEGPSWLQ